LRKKTSFIRERGEGKPKGKIEIPRGAELCNGGRNTSVEGRGKEGPILLLKISSFPQVKGVSKK